LIAVKKNSETISTLPFSVISVLLAVEFDMVVTMVFACFVSSFLLSSFRLCQKEKVKQIKKTVRSSIHPTHSGVVASRRSVARSIHNRYASSSRRVAAQRARR
jgi:hypothetical protein